jgi:hypothetical protein
MEVSKISKDALMLHEGQMVIAEERREGFLPKSS